MSSWLVTTVAAVAVAASGAHAAEQNIDLDGDPANGAESRLETNVLQSYPVKIENVIFNNAAEQTFSFIWPGAGPGGFDAYVTPGPDVGIKWEWTTLSQVYSIQAPIQFVPVGDDDPRGIGVFGAPSGGVQLPAQPRSFVVPGKSIFPSQITLSGATLTSSLITFFSPEQTLATCESTFVPGRFEQTLTNNTGEPITFDVEQEDCCPEPGMIICEDGCQSYRTDVNNCGGCGVECASDEYCDEGSCEPICDPGQILCGEICVDALNDPANCGGCGVTCDADEFCDGGACAPICPGETLCGEVCVDTFTDDANCGGCGIACAFDEFCDAGSCEPICAAGETYCDGTCVDTSNDPDNCGSCGNACGPLYVCADGACAPDCPAGQILCGDTCVDPLTDDDACGACGNVCAEDEFCDGGACAPICPGQTYCDGDCVDLDSDPLNCGACGNVCGENSVCEDGACKLCRPPRPTACNNVCTNTNTDAYNCGECGFVCDFSGCPSGGQGACSQGTSCVCEDGSAALSRDADTPLLFPPVRSGRAELRALPSSEPDRTRTRTGSRRAGSTAVAARTTMRADAATTRSAVVEAPVCDVSQVVTTLEPGESLTRCFDGAVTGKEVFTRATVTQSGEVIGQGPCAVVVPDTDTPPAPFLPAITSIQVLDASGDGLCQPGEEWCEILVSVVNLGTDPFPPSAATISVPEDPFNPTDVTILGATVNFDAFPAFDQVADCQTEPTLEPISGQQTFRFSLDPEQEPDVARPLLITFDAGGTTVDMPFVLGIGRGCDPNDLDGENYDEVRGFLSPVNADLVPAGLPVNFSTGNFNRGSAVPLKMRLACGGLTLNGGQLDPHPEIVAIVNTATGPIDLSAINADNNSNPDDPFFTCGSNRCEFNLNTDNLVPGDYVIRVAMPDTRVYEAGVTIRQ